MKVGPLLVTLSTGRQCALADLYQERPLLLIFLRHFGCIFCREVVKELREKEDWNILFVGQGSPDQAAEFRSLLKSPHPIAADPDARLYDEFGIGRAGIGGVVNLEVLKRGIEASRKQNSQGKTSGDPWRLPAEFIISPQGEVVWEHRARHVADTSRPDELSKALKRVEKLA